MDGLPEQAENEHGRGRAETKKYGGKTAHDMLQCTKQEPAAGDGGGEITTARQNLRWTKKPPRTPVDTTAGWYPVTSQ